MNTAANHEAQYLAQADLLLLCADLLRMPGAYEPDAWSDALAQLEDLLALAGFAPASSSPHAGKRAGEGRRVHEALRQALEAASATAAEEWSDEYHRLFDASMICPPNQTAYVRRDKGAVIADITGFYRAFGFAPRAEVGEKPDHIVTELEFVAALLAMQAAAESNPERQAIVRDALVAFATTHLNDWICIFTGRLEMVTALPLYVAVARALADTCCELLQSHGLPLPELSGVNAQDEPESPYECGMAEAEAAEVDLHIRGERRL